MKDNKKSRSLLQQQTGEKQERTVTFMPLSNFITKCRGSKAYFRGLVVRAIEDALVLLIMGTCIWTICTLAGEILAKMGVA